MQFPKHNFCIYSLSSSTCDIELSKKSMERNECDFNTNWRHELKSKHKILTQMWLPEAVFLPCFETFLGLYLLCITLLIPSHIHHLRFITLAICDLQVCVMNPFSPDFFVSFCSLAPFLLLLSRQIVSDKQMFMI